MWNSIVSVPDHRLLINFIVYLGLSKSNTTTNMYIRHLRSSGNITIKVATLLGSMKE